MKVNEEIPRLFPQSTAALIGLINHIDVDSNNLKGIRSEEGFLISPAVSES